MLLLADGVALKSDCESCFWPEQSDWPWFQVSFAHVKSIQSFKLPYLSHLDDLLGTLGHNAEVKEYLSILS